MSPLEAGSLPLPSALAPAEEDLRTSYLSKLGEQGIRVSVVIPALNEAENLRALLPNLPEECELVVVDGHSTDGTVEVVWAVRPDAIVVQQPGKGKGDALISGFAATSGDLIVTMDADGSTDPSELSSFLRVLMDGADFAKGSRLLAGGGSKDLTRFRRLGNRLLVQLFNVLYSKTYTDLCYGYNAFWRDCIQHMPANAAGFEIETQIHTWMAFASVNVVEVPSFELARRFGSSHLRPIQDGFRVVWVILSGRISQHRTPPPARVIDLRDGRTHLMGPAIRRHALAEGSSIQ